MIKNVLFILFAGVILVSCTKDDKVSKTTQEMIVGKWKVNTIVEEDTSIPFTYTYTGVSSDYIDFRNDGKVYYNTAFGSVPGPDTFTYKVLNNQYIVEGNYDTFEIKTLTDTKLILHYQNTIGSYRYTEDMYK